MSNVAWLLIAMGGLWLSYIVVTNSWTTIKSWLQTSTTTVVVSTTASDLSSGSAACVTLANIALNRKDQALAAKVSEVFTLLAKIPDSV